MQGELPCESCPHEMECNSDSECLLSETQIRYYNQQHCDTCIYYQACTTVTHNYQNDLRTTSNPIRSNIVQYACISTYCNYTNKYRRD